MTGGNIVLNGITEAQLIKILQEKEKTRGFAFNLQNVQQSMMASPAQGGQPSGPAQIYNNVNLTWQNEQGLQVIRELLGKLLHPHEHG